MLTREQDSAIAVIGMSAEAAGATDLLSLWTIIQAGTSQHEEVPEARFTFSTPWRDSGKKTKTASQWFGNFLQHYDSFDHKFFKKSPREAASIDPQQRRLLHATYQALEQSGYFNAPQDHNVGCFVGVTDSSYQDNLSCHPPNAFTTTGLMRSLLAGRLSHHFGWTGPSLSLDTACSSSLVAIHYACQSILSGECHLALAGASNCMTTPIMHQNLAAASFLSPTGPCKPFDASADGYCRGEGVGVVLLKSKTRAIADGDPILAWINASVVRQMTNETPIVVPNTHSLTALYRQVLTRAQLSPEQIDYVEAHGTGTVAGDKAEYEGILNVFGGPNRASALPFGSLKGSIGHTESASGVLALIKVILMMQSESIPPQSSFRELGSHLNASPSDNIEVATSPKPWNASTKRALVSNYGASGCIASLVVSQVTQRSHRNTSAQSSDFGSDLELPFWLCGSDEEAVKRYSKALLVYMRSPQFRNYSINDLSFALCRQSNRTLPCRVLLRAFTIQDLEQQLSEMTGGVPRRFQPSSNNNRPVILCFGGQNATFIGLDRNIYENARVLHAHLDTCDQVLCRLQSHSVYPAIFQRTPIDDIVQLQVSLFSIQYASAMAWIDCGIAPSALIGHSFGELSALCVAGVLSLEDALKLIIRRAVLIRDHWGPEKGAMIAVEGSEADVKELLNSCNAKLGGKNLVSIACFNYPAGFTLAGSARAIETLSEIASGLSSRLPLKRLLVTNAFHSELVNPLMPLMDSALSDLKFHAPEIPLEPATEFESLAKIDSSFVVRNTRSPVYFSHAAQRLAATYPSAIWLEAGSNSGIARLAAKALCNARGTYFQSTQLSGRNAMSDHARSCMNLWAEGVNVMFWPHHSSQRYDYSRLLLPPYQFDEHRHWTDPKLPVSDGAETMQRPTQVVEESSKLWSFVDGDPFAGQTARFWINTSSVVFREALENHILLGIKSLCPSTLILEIVVDAALSLHKRSKYQETKINPVLVDTKNQALISHEDNVSLWLKLEPVSGSKMWDWKYESEAPSSRRILHATGSIDLCPADSKAHRNDFWQYERLAKYSTCKDLLYHDEADHILQGKHVYTSFSEILLCGPAIRGLHRLVGKGTCSAGRVKYEYDDRTWLNANLSECLGQVAVIFINSMTDCKSEDMYIATGIQKWIRSPAFGESNDRPTTWDVLGYHHRDSENLWVSDLFVFDSRNGRLLEVIIGIDYQRVSKHKMKQILNHPRRDLVLSAQHTTDEPSVPAEDLTDSCESRLNELYMVNTSMAQGQNKDSDPGKYPTDVLRTLTQMISDLMGIDEDDIQPYESLEALGVDSLMGMEIASEIESTFNCNFSHAQIYDITSIKDFADAISFTINNANRVSSTDCGDSYAYAASRDDYEVDHVAEISLSPKIDVESSSVDSVPSGTVIPSSVVDEAFESVRSEADCHVVSLGIDGYFSDVLPIQDELCIALICEAFERLGCSLKTARPGIELSRIRHASKHHQFVDCLYNALARVNLARLINGRFVRSEAVVPNRRSEEIYRDLIENHGKFACSHELTWYMGAELSAILEGATESIQLLFGTSRGRSLGSSLYAELLLNRATNAQMEQILERLIQNLDFTEGPLRIFEVGAGTGGTTSGMVALFERIGVPVEYTFTDISSSLVAKARKVHKDRPFMRFQTYDFETPSPKQLLGTQHIIIATNAMHATPSLKNTTRNVRGLLRSDGFLMLMEMTQPLLWVDMIFGGVEGWWLFDDGREHSVATPSRWKEDLLAAGFNHVDWTGGQRPETNWQRVFIARM